MLGLALAVLFALGLNGMGPWNLQSSAAGQDLTAALARYAAAPAVHVRGTFSRDGHVLRVDVVIDKSGDSQGTVIRDGSQVQVRTTGGRTYGQAGADFWTAEGKLATFFAGRWATSSDQLADLTTPSLSRALSLLDVARPGATFDRVARDARVAGTAAVVLGDRSGEISISRAAPQRLLRLVSSPTYRTADGVTDVDVALDFPPAAVTVQAPSPTVSTDDPVTQPAQYVADPNSVQHGGDCDAASSCTVSVSVVNQRGPQVGPATVDMHLVRDDGGDLGTCTATIRPAAHDQSETVGCTVSGANWVAFTRVGGRYRAEVTVHNPLYDA